MKTFSTGRLRKSVRWALPFCVAFQSAAAQVVISQVYGGGGNAGAALKHDYIELFNRGTLAVDLTGWSVQYASASSDIWRVTPLAGSIHPGQYLLVQQAQGAGGVRDLPAADIADSVAMSASAGKVALLREAGIVSGTCPAREHLEDVLSYGLAATACRGSPAPGLDNTRAAFRAAGGCADTGDNAADFHTGEPNPRNASYPIAICSSAPSPTTCEVTHSIAGIQGRWTASPVDGKSVTTRGIVTGLKSNGFFIQMPAPGDGDPETSDGILVFTSSAPPAIAAIGNEVCVTGPVAEYIPASDPFSPPTTEISRPRSVLLMGVSGALPAPVPIAPDEVLVNDLDNLEKYEGMRVMIPSLLVVAPTEGSVNETDAAAISNGVFYGVLPGLPRPFREAGVRLPDLLPEAAPCCVPRFDGNPELIRVDSDAQPGAQKLDVATGTAVSNLVGILDYSYRSYTLLPEAATRPCTKGNRSATPIPTPTDTEITIASFNIERFYDTFDDPDTSDPVLTPAAFEKRLNKASLLIRDVLHSPDILGLTEVENLATLEALAGKLNNDSAAVSESPNYVAYLEPGNDIGGINIGFLVKTSTVEAVEVTQHGKDAIFVDPANGRTELLHDRPPLLLRALAAKPGSSSPLSITVVANHFRSLTGIDSPTAGARIRAKRELQAEFLASLIQARQAADPSENIVVLGDFNAYELNDGYVDVMGVIAGNPAPADSVVLAGPDLVEPDFTLLDSTLPAEERYTYVYEGNAQALDHILVNAALLPLVTGFAVARVNADFPESLRGGAGRPERLSDHDPLVVYISQPATAIERSPPEAGSATAGGAMAGRRKVQTEGDAGRAPYLSAR